MLFHCLLYQHAHHILSAVSSLLSEVPKSHSFRHPCPYILLLLRVEAIIRNAADDVISPCAMPWYKQAIGARVSLSSVDARSMLVEVQVDWDGAGGTLEEVEVGGDIALRCWGGGGKEREEGDESSDGKGLHGVDW